MKILALLMVLCVGSFIFLSSKGYLVNPIRTRFDLLAERFDSLTSYAKKNKDWTRLANYDDELSELKKEWDDFTTKYPLEGYRTEQQKVLWHELDDALSKFAREAKVDRQRSPDAPQIHPYLLKTKNE